MMLPRPLSRVRIRAPQLTGAAFRRTLASVPTINSHYADVDPVYFRDVTDRLQRPALIQIGRAHV